MKRWLCMVLAAIGCGGSVSNEPAECAPYAYPADAALPLYPCDDDPARPHDGQQYAPVVVSTDAGSHMTCVCVAAKGP